MAITQRTYRHRIVRRVEDGALTATASSPTWDLSELSAGMPSEQVGFERIGVLIRTTAVSGTSPTLAVAFELSEDGVNWETPSNALTGLNVVGVRTALNVSAYPARFVRLRFTLGGTSPSFTFEARLKVVI